MKHLKKFNGSKSEMQLEDYFVEFVDEGFTIERKLNEFKLKYTGEYDFSQTLEMYNDVISKLQAYGKDITKTDLSYRKSVTNVLIEVKNIAKLGDEIEITLRGEKIKLIPHAYSIYSIYGMPELSKEDIKVKVQNANINIDLESCKKVIETIKKNEITPRSGGERMLDVFTETITPELLTK